MILHTWITLGWERTFQCLVIHLRFSEKLEKLKEFTVKWDSWEGGRSDAAVQAMQMQEQEAWCRRQEWGNEHCVWRKKDKNPEQLEGFKRILCAGQERKMPNPETQKLLKMA